MARVRRAGGARLSLALGLSLGVGLSLAVPCAMRSARAEPSQKGAPAWLSGYRAEVTCPEVRVFVDAVERRRARPAVGADDRTRLSVIVSGEGGAYSGVIEISDGAEHTRRVVAGTDCAEVTEALSLIAAMGLDAGARPGPVEDGSNAPARVAGSEVDVRAPAPMRSDEDEELALGVGVLGVANGAAAPGAAMGLGGALALQWRAGGWQPALLVSAFGATGDDVSFADGTARARFELLAGAAQLCPLRFPVQGRWALRPCFELELGQLSGTSSGSAVRDAATRSGLWSSVNLGARGDIDVWGPLRIMASVAAVVPLARHEYSFSPDTTTAFQVPALSFRAAGWVGVFF